MPRPTYPQGEILPPLPRSTAIPQRPFDTTSDEHLNLIATWLDDRFVIPGFNIRFGLDALIGWIPGVGDVLAALASLFIVFAAWKRGAARITILRMMLNLAIEDTLGAIPVIGDVAHIAWKANRRNYNLLVRDQRSARPHNWGDWLFVTAICFLLFLLMLAPFLLLVYLFKFHRPLY